MKKKQTIVNAPLYILALGFILGEIFLDNTYPRLATLLINFLLGIALIIRGWTWNIRVHWSARFIFMLGVLWLGYLFLYYVTGFNNPQF